MTAMIHASRTGMESPHQASPSTPHPGVDLDEIRRRILITVRHACPGWMANDVEDVAQNALIKVCQVLEREGERKRDLPPSYLWKVACTATVDAMRSRRSRRQGEVPMEGAAERILAPTDAPDPERRTTALEVGRAITDCLQRLVRPRRLAAMLHLQGHTVPETARLMHWSEAKANNLVYRGIADLRRCLAGKGWSP
jgi:RNA polymerase sigma-70 factor (ECF subfamily)